MISFNEFTRRVQFYFYNAGLSRACVRRPGVCSLIFLAVFFAGCNREDNKLKKISGNAQGTTYHITYLSDDNFDRKKAIDSIFEKIDSSLSTYLPASIISRVNKNDTSVVPDDHFINVFNKAKEVSENTNGKFDITVAPIINAWGFGFSKKATVDSAMIDSLLGFVGYKMAKVEDKRIVKGKPQVMFDFNAIAPGYTVDVLAIYLENNGIRDYVIELGGEVKAKGKKEDGSYWKVGIDQPNEEQTGGRPLKAIITLNDRALATSGNYRKFYVENGQKRAHIIDPHTGYPADHHLLSATVLAADCATADAYATAFMVMGVNNAKQFLAAHPELGLQVFFIYDENGKWNTYSSGSLKPQLEELP